MQQNRVKPMVEGGILSAISILFAIIGAYVPLLGAFATLIWPVPIILLGVRHGYKWSILSLVTAGVLIAILVHPLQAVLIAVGFGLVGIVMGYTIRLNYKPVKVLICGSAAFLISQIAVFLITMAVMGINPVDTQINEMLQGMQGVIDSYRQIGVKEEDLAKITELTDFMKDYLKIIFPAGLAMAAFFVTFVNFLAAKIVLKRLGHHVEAFPPLKYWSLPRYIVYIFIMAIGLMLWGKSQEYTLLYNIGVNCQAVTSILLMLQGVALFYFLADKYKLSRFLRGIILILIFTSLGLFIQIFVLAGAFDIVFDYRRLKTGDEL